MSEFEIVKRAQAGQFEAFTELVNAHKDKLYAFVRKLTGNPEDANDIVQDTFLKAIDKIDQFRGESSFGTWLTSIALNQARGMFAKRRQADLRPLEEYLPAGTSDGPNPLAHASLFDWRDPHSELEAAELHRLVEEGLAEIPFVYREAFFVAVCRRDVGQGSCGGYRTIRSSCQVPRSAGTTGTPRFPLQTV
jgi:RNA polymerase sigma-70 factor, ECF subfamily